MGRSRVITPKRRIEHLEMSIKEARNLAIESDDPVYQGLIVLYQVEMEKWKNHVDVKNVK